MSALKRRAAFTQALIEVQKSLGTTRVSSTSFWDACYAPLLLNELAVSQTIRMEEGKVVITTVLSHAAGHKEEHSLDVKPRAGARFGQLVEFFAFQNLIGALGLLPPNDAESVFSAVPNDAP